MTALRTSAAAVFLLLILALGHTISNLVRTMPAVSADVIATDLAIAPADVAALTGLYHLGFALGQIPVGVALDRYGVRPVSMVLLLIVAIGALGTAFVSDSLGFGFTQFVLGLGCSGMLLCPLTYAAKTQDGPSFALWSALVLAVGNSGMVLSASPLAYVIDGWGWRVAFAVPCGMALAVTGAVWLRLRDDKPASCAAMPIIAEVREVVRIGVSPALRGVVALSLVSFAVMIGIRGVWAGPWLMEDKGLGRIEAANAILLLTVMLIVMPMVVSVIERRVGHAGRLLVGGHVLAGLCLVALPLGTGLAVGYDVALLAAFGAFISVQPLLFAMGRHSVTTQNAGKALSAVNLAFFTGAAIVQVLSSPVAAWWGTGGVIV
ncbi:MAG TPA: MFS transporter, partial [Pelagibacterium sp.]|uniref:MFS transporter n=1 Tax=Pelagibacterium sp. TaxID=1967288 RepID=UPI002C0722B8